MDRLMEDALVRPSRISTWLGEPHLALDIYQTKDTVVVKAPLPGVKPEDVEITITGDVLTIKGETKVEENVEKEDYFFQERRYGSFSRSVTLPDGLKTDKAEASFEDGVLTLTVPKAEEHKPKSVKVKAKKVATPKAEVKAEAKSEPKQEAKK